MNNSDNASALPAWGNAEIPPDRDRTVDSEERGFLDIIKIFIRTWPFMLPQIVGYWRQVPQRTSAGSDASESADSTAGSGAAPDNGWSFRYVPFLVTFLTTLGPLTGWLPLGADSHWTLDLLLAGTGVMTAITWVLMFANGRAYVVLSLTLALIGTAAFLCAVFVVDGLADNVQVGLVSAGCICIWVLQYRIADGRLQFRIRLGSHLVYYYILTWVMSIFSMIVGLFSVDLISQSILQAEPLTQTMADFIRRPELAQGSVAGPAVDGEAESDSARSAKMSGSGAEEPGAASEGETGNRSSEAGKGNGTAAASIELRLLTPEQRHGLKWVYVAFMIAMWLIMLLPSMAMPYYYVFVMQRINQDLRSALVKRWHRLSLRYHADHRVGDSVYRIYQDSSQVTAVIGSVLKVTQILNGFAVAIVFVSALDPILGIMALSVVVGGVAWGRWFSPRMRVQSLVARETNSDLTSRVQEMFSAIRIVKAYGAEETEQERLDQDSVVAFNAAYRVRSLIVIIGIVTFTISVAVLLAGQYLMAVWASSGREVFASALVFIVGLSFIRWNLSAYTTGQQHINGASGAVRGLVSEWAQAQDMAMGLDRVFNILDIEPDVKNDPEAVPLEAFDREIRFDNVSFAYEADRPVLRDISLAVEPGTITAIVGPTGSGKSTLMSLLSRLFDPDSGSVSIDGTDLRKLDVDSLRSAVSIALQENVLFGTSVRDNIRYVVPDADDEQVRQAAAVACVDDYIAELPEGLDTVLSDRGGTLSTGQRQRLNIARAVIKDAPILILDEPTAALDARTEHRVLDRLAAWGKGRAIFLITHRISTIQRADQILYLDQGEIVESGSHAELMQQTGGRYRSFVETEAMLSKRSGDSPDKEGR